MNLPFDEAAADRYWERVRKGNPIFELGGTMTQDEQFESLLETAAIQQALGGLRKASDRLAKVCGETKAYLDTEIERRHNDIQRLDSLERGAGCYEE